MGDKYYGTILDMVVDRPRTKEGKVLHDRAIQVRAKCRLDTAPDGPIEQPIICFSYFALVSKTGQPVQSQIEAFKRSFDWDGKKFSGLANADFADKRFQFDCSFENDGKLTIDWINPESGQAMTRPDSNTLDELDKQLASLGDEESDGDNF